MYPLSDHVTRRVVSPISSTTEAHVPATNATRSPGSQRPGWATSIPDRGSELPRYTVSEARESRSDTVNEARAPRIPEGNDSGVRETRLVIGLDFGTTYTGVAYATPRGTACPLNEITVISDWGNGMENLDKVPSVISYTKCSAEYQQWGKSISPDAVTMVHKKLELGPHPLQGELDLVVQVLEGMRNLNFEDIILANEDNNVPAYACKSPEEIVTDYLTKIFAYLDQTVADFSDQFRRYTATDIVVTVPTHWPYEALNSTYRAVTKAGFNRVNFPKLNDLLFVTESEAAARYTVRHYKEEKASDFLHDNSYFVLCDAGGGTVDVVSYKVIRTRPTLQLQQIGRPTGAKCGSVFINQRFKRWLRRKIGDNNYRVLDPDLNMDKTASHSSETPAMRQLMEDFDIRKERFTALDNRGAMDIRIDLPPPLDTLHVPGVVTSGVLLITREKMESFFDDCLLQIVRLIRGHMTQIENVAGGKAKNLFLVGGFGSSEYLSHYIKETMSDYRIRFRTPDTSWTAIVQGAVVCGIDNAQIQTVRTARSCPCSYGVSMDEAFQETNHARDDLIEEPDGQLYARAQLIWLLDEGDVLIADEPRKVRKEFDISFLKTQGHVDLPIYQHSLQHGENQDDRPDRLKTALDEITQAAVLRVDLAHLRDLVGGRGFRESMYREARHSSLRLMEGVFFSALKSQYRVTLVLELERTWDALRASVSWGKHELARITTA